MGTEMLQARENLMEAIQAFLKEYVHIPPKEKCKTLLLADERFIKIKQAVEEEQNQPEVMQELLLKFMNDLQILNGIQPKQEEPIDFLPAEFVGELDLIDPILPRIDEDDFDEEEGAVDIDILQIKDEILCEKLLKVNFLINKIKALNLTPSIPFVLEYPSSSPIPVMDSDFLIEEVDTFLVSEDSIPPGIESDFDSEGVIIFLNDLLNDDPIPEYERFTFDIEPDAPVINNFDELNEDECFDPGGGEINASLNVEDDHYLPFVTRIFLPFLTYHEDSPLLLSTGSEDIIFDPGIST
ncbi:hypothetical protein Tco_0745041 [Tanacetum coccineum]